MADEFDDLIRAVAQNEIRRLHPEFFGQPLLDIKRVAVRIKMQVRNGLLHRRQRRGRRAERIFVRRQLDDVRRRQAQFARHFLNRPARLVNRHVLQRGIEGQGRG